jgi:integrase
MNNIVDSIVKRRLTNTHMSLVRGWVQGIELTELADRYLSGIGEAEEGVDLRVAKTALMWILDDLAALAKRAGIQGGVTLKRQASRIRLEPNAPTLADFASTLDDPDFYNESELVALYQDAYGGTSNAAARGESRRSRLITRQLNLLTDLTHHLTAAMSLRDRIDSWFEDSISSRLDASNLITIEDLVVEIVRQPEDWFEAYRGIGPGKAARLTRFLVAQLGDLGDALAVAGIYIPVAPQKVTPDEKLFEIVNQLPALPYPTHLVGQHSGELDSPKEGLYREGLDGSNGRLRSSSGQSATTANNDYEALEEWLRKKKSERTKVLYRRELQRLIAWSVTVKKIPISSLSTRDAEDYKDFLLNVPPEWIGRKGRGNNVAPGQWKAFAGSLSISSTNKALAIIHAFFAWALKSGYIVAQPFADIKAVVALPPMAEQSTSADDLASLELASSIEQSVVTRTLPFAAIQAIEDELKHAEKDPFLIRAGIAFHLAIATGMRISELALARRQSLTRHEHTAKDPGYWELSVVGKRSQIRNVPIPDSIISELVHYFSHRGLPDAIGDVPPGTFLIGKFPGISKSTTADASGAIVEPTSNGDGVRPETIHRTLKELFRRASNRLAINDFESARRLRKASAHWLRHTCATDAVAADVPLDVVSSTLGHKSIGTTSKYIHAEDRRKAREMLKYWSRDQ